MPILVKYQVGLEDFATEIVYVDYGSDNLYFFNPNSPLQAEAIKRVILGFVDRETFVDVPVPTIDLAKELEMIHSKAYNTKGFNL